VPEQLLTSDSLLQLTDLLFQVSDYLLLGLFLVLVLGQLSAYFIIDYLESRKQKSFTNLLTGEIVYKDNV